jgi:hypothetical protein
VDVELAEPLADLETLRDMAQRTARIGGRYVDIRNLEDLLQEIRAQKPVTSVTRTERTDLVSGFPWIWFGGFVALLSLEWIVRRRAGLV